MQVSLTQSSGMTLGDALDNANEMYWRGGKSESEYAYKINAIRRAFGAKSSIEDISTNMIDDWIMRMKRDSIKGSTINRHLAVLSRTLRLAFEQDRLTKLPKFRRQPESKGKLRYFTKDEEHLILLTLKSWNQDYLHDCLLYTSPSPRD